MKIAGIFPPNSNFQMNYLKVWISSFYNLAVLLLMSPNLISVFHGFVQADPSFCFKKFHTGNWCGGQFSRKHCFHSGVYFPFYFFQFTQCLKKVVETEFTK